MKTDGNEPITAGRFQVKQTYEGGFSLSSHDFLGLTKREYFSSQFMAAILTSRPDGLQEADIENIAKDAVLIADKFIDQLNQKESK